MQTEGGVMGRRTQACKATVQRRDDKPGENGSSATKVGKATPEEGMSTWKERRGEREAEASFGTTGKAKTSTEQAWAGGKIWCLSTLLSQ